MMPQHPKNVSVVSRQGRQVPMDPAEPADRPRAGDGGKWHRNTNSFPQAFRRVSVTSTTVQKPFCDKQRWAAGMMAAGDPGFGNCGGESANTSSIDRNGPTLRCCCGGRHMEI